MAEFRAAHGAGRDWKAACLAAIGGLGELGPGFTLGFVYVSDPIGGELPAIHDHLRQATGIADWVGAVGYGVCGLGGSSDAPPSGQEYFDQPAVALLVTDLAREDYRIFATISGDHADYHARHDAWMAEAQPPIIVVHRDSHNPRTPELIGQLAEESSAFLVGGMASFTNRRSQVAGSVTGGGLSGVMFSSRVAVVSGLSQGCAPLGPARRITDAQGNVIAALDGRRALDVLKEDLGIDDDAALRRVAPGVNVAVLVPGSDVGDYFVRNLVGLDPARGLVAIGDNVEPGARIMFCGRDRDTAIGDLKRMVGGVAQRTESAAKAALYFSCIARGPNLFGPDAEEVRLLRAALGAIPLVGFYANGEISHNRLYGYTGVLAAFR